MHDPRKPRPFRPRTLSVLICDDSNFSRGLIADILRNLNIGTINGARSARLADSELIERKLDLILLSAEGELVPEALAFIRQLRKNPDDRVRRLPVILITSALTRQLVIDARDAGVDEFVAKPITPAALQQRLQMVIETPRPFVDCPVYVGPCRRRKNPADYYGTKRRRGDRKDDAASKSVDLDEVAAQTPIRKVLAELREACRTLNAGGGGAKSIMALIAKAKQLATADKDTALVSSLAAFEAYISVAGPRGQASPSVVETALAALEQLAALPQNYADARESVAIALGKAIQRRLAA